MCERERERRVAPRETGEEEVEGGDLKIDVPQKEGWGDEPMYM